MGWIVCVAMVRAQRSARESASVEMKIRSWKKENAFAKTDSGCMAANASLARADHLTKMDDVNVQKLSESNPGLDEIHRILSI